MNQFPYLSPSYQQRIFNFLPVILLHLLAFLGVLTSLHAQYTPCSNIPPTKEEMEKVDKDLANFQPSTSNFIWDIPVRVTIFRKTDGSQLLSLTEADVDAFLFNMNTKLVGGSNAFHFFRCGPTNYIDSDQLYNPTGSSFLHSDYSYNRGFLNLYLYQGGGAPHTIVPWGPEPRAVFLTAGPLDIADGNGFHELGHSLGLGHTFAPDDPYQVPAVPGQPDYPYKIDGRELVIRDTTPGKSFPFPNAKYAGDRVADTPAGCKVTNGGGQYPSSATIAGCIDNNPATPCLNGCFDNNPATPCLNGCSFDLTTCTYTGDYRDYNFDLLVNPYNILAKNYMSYTSYCRQNFTTGQIERADLMTNFYLYDYYREELCGNLLDRVEIEGSNVGLSRVRMRIRPTADTSDQTRTVVSTIGDFSGKLPSNTLTTQVTAELKRYNKTNISQFDREWVSGLATSDLLCISNHILGINPLDNGYRILAADANNSNTITATDILLLRKLILGIDTSLAAYSHPWRFIPEAVTQKEDGTLQKDFDGVVVNGNIYDNPFATTAVGSATPSLIISPSLYCSSTWPFFMRSGTSRNGFDAVKIGNICGPIAPSQSDKDCPGNVALLVPKTSVSAGRTVELRMKGFGFQSVAAFQIGLKASMNDFEYVSGVSSTLPGFSESNSIGGLNLGKDNLKVLWLRENSTSTTLTDGSTIFTIRLKAKENIDDLSELITLDGDVLETYFLSGEGGCKTATSLEIAASVENLGGGSNERNMKINPIGPASSKLHCIPNPASDQATLLFDADQSFEGHISIYDLQGRRLKLLPYSFEAGRNVIALSNFEQLPVSVLHITIFDGHEMHTVRVVKR